MAHANTADKTTRYWFKVNPGNNKICDFKIGAHHLSNEEDENNKKQWYIDDNWTVNLANGNACKETYLAEKEEYLKEEKKHQNVKAKGEDIVMVEIRGTAMSLWIDNKEVAHDVFVDKELNGPLVHVVVDFDTTDGDSVHYYGYDELPINEPSYKPVATAPAQKPKSPQKPKPAPKKK